MFGTRTHVSSSRTEPSMFMSTSVCSLIDHVGTSEASVCWAAAAASATRTCRWTALRWQNFVLACTDKHSATICTNPHTHTSHIFIRMWVMFYVLLRICDCPPRPPKSLCAARDAAQSRCVDGSALPPARLNHEPPRFRMHFMRRRKR